MTEPEQKSSLALSNPPLICVVARVQFTPISKIKEYVDDLQEALRLCGYPLFEPRKTNALRIDNQAQAGMNVSFKEVPQWIFANIDKTVSIRIDGESLTILFTDYLDFSGAQAHYDEILGAVENSVPSITSIENHLRYINHIPIKEGSSPDQWVGISMLGMPNLGEIRRQASVSETSFQTPEGGRLVVRCSALPNGLTMPPDLLPLDMALKHTLHCEQPFLMLENLHIQKAKKTQFSAKTCLSELSALRPFISKVFQETVTKEALTIWK